MRVSVPLRDSYRLLNHGPTTLVSSCEPDGSAPNVMAAAWAMPLDLDPPKVAVVVSGETLTREKIERAGEFVLSLPTVAMLDQVYAVGTKSGREIDKWSKALGLRTESATRVKPPLVLGCVGWLECRVFGEKKLREDHDLVLGEVLAAWADDEVYREREWRFGAPDDPRRTIHHLARGAFFATGIRLDAKR